MDSKIMNFHLSRNILVFIRAHEIIEQENEYSIGEIVQTFDELSSYEKEINKIKHQLIDATYEDILSTLLEPVDELFEQEFE